MVGGQFEADLISAIDAGAEHGIAEQAPRAARQNSKPHDVRLIDFFATQCEHKKQWRHVGGRRAASARRAGGGGGREMMRCRGRFAMIASVIRILHHHHHHHTNVAPR
jgi:hypothetical protein